MKRREFITLLGTAVAWPLTARAQTGQQMLHVGVLVPQAETDPEQQAWIAAFVTRLRELGWSQGNWLSTEWKGKPTIQGFARIS